ncbi:iron ABC transporter permease [Alicyclobacillus cycloheptanicus]|uniref:Iron complex transport system permease protein n=1 Tax=Alicyclobacillus cycloheptanicus TaxID=1457 RepID=A0ABT9XEP1_9BACL|nr:iron ABC transporter permease [Alicyclobacillus cycloheptanicus]MDQ0188752.1 iron complex transport system permease protein [Alicyclobacillus cycloheptanicus]WDM00588.1 iron ABC transporter permease [Alicyclobacillus cycloheptanicus]
MHAYSDAVVRSQGKRRHRAFAATWVIAGGLAALTLSVALSISVGADHVPLPAVWNAVFHFNAKQTSDQVIHTIRLPRAAAALLVGAAFAVAGSLMQGMTRNPLADPGLLGINSGSEFVLAVCMASDPHMPFFGLLMLSFCGAGLGAALVYGMGSLSKGGLTPVRLTLSGAAVSALLVALSQGIALYFGLSQDLSYWLAGGLSNTTWLQVHLMFPWVAAGLIAALLLSKPLTVLSLGEDVAGSLGQRPGLIQAAAAATVLVLAGSAVSVAGPIGFVGLVIPHLARFAVGVDYRLVIPCSAVLGGLLLVLSDLGARMIHPPYETPIGAVIALVGVPFFLYLTRRSRRGL